jgi:hypothetical protein
LILKTLKVLILTLRLIAAGLIDLSLNGKFEFKEVYGVDIVSQLRKGLCVGSPCLPKFYKDP